VDPKLVKILSNAVSAIIQHLLEVQLEKDYARTTNNRSMNGDVVFIFKVTGGDNGSFYDDYVIRFNHDGTGSSGVDSLWNSTPMYMSTDSQGRLYVAAWEPSSDGNTETGVHIYSPSGTFIKRIGGTGGCTSEDLLNPADIDVDNSGYIYVLDTGNMNSNRNRIVKFAPCTGSSTVCN
jgi:hypothetical protein